MQAQLVSTIQLALSYDWLPTCSIYFQNNSIQI